MVSTPGREDEGPGWTARASGRRARLRAGVEELVRERGETPQDGVAAKVVHCGAPRPRAWPNSRCPGCRSDTVGAHRGLPRREIEFPLFRLDPPPPFDGQKPRSPQLAGGGSQLPVLGLVPGGGLPSAPEARRAKRGAAPQAGTTPRVPACARQGVRRFSPALEGGGGIESDLINPNN